MLLHHMITPRVVSAVLVNVDATCLLSYEYMTQISLASLTVVVNGTIRPRPGLVGRVKFFCRPFR